MQDLPIRYFDTHLNGDIMSYYQWSMNVRRMIGTSLPNLLFTRGYHRSSIHHVLLQRHMAIVVPVWILFDDATKNLGGRVQRTLLKDSEDYRDVEDIRKWWMARKSLRSLVMRRNYWIIWQNQRWADGCCQEMQTFMPTYAYAILNNTERIMALYVL